MDEPLELTDGRWNVFVAPSLGGSLVTCEHDGIEVLRPVAQPGGSALASHCCSFPLVPFSNRIENSRFSFDGRATALTPNVSGSPHAIHGHGWQAAWHATDRTAERCALALGHDANLDWPWSYRARQEIALAEGALQLTLAIENTGRGHMPCGLGFHPFLPRDSSTRLAFQATGVGNRRAGEFPTEQVPIEVPFCFRDGPRVAEREGLDHCYDGWPGRVEVSNGERGFTLEGCAETPYLIVYTPAGADYYCVEPVTHAVNAMNLANASALGWWRLAPREERRITMRIRPRGS